MATSWTPERKARQAELIRQWKPWAKSTGPRSDQGKEWVARNAWRGGRRQKLSELSKMVNAEIRHARQMITAYTT